jgi:hypothetical protein
LDGILLATLVSVGCGAGDRARIEDYASESFAGLRPYLPFAQGVPSVRAWRKVLRLIAPPAGLAPRAVSLRASLQTGRGVSTGVFPVRRINRTRIENGDRWSRRGRRLTPDPKKQMRFLSCPGNYPRALTMSPNLLASTPGDRVFSSIYSYPAVEAETEFGLNPERNV